MVTPTKSGIPERRSVCPASAHPTPRTVPLEPSLGIISLVLSKQNPFLRLPQVYIVSLLPLVSPLVRWGIIYHSQENSEKVVEAQRHPTKFNEISLLPRHTAVIPLQHTTHIAHREPPHTQLIPTTPMEVIMDMEALHPMTNIKAPLVNRCIARVGRILQPE